MAIEIAFLSVVLRKSSVERLAAEAQDLVQAIFHWEPDWFREDEHLLGTCFMCPADVRTFGSALHQRTSLRRDQDWSVVDMVAGPIVPAHWQAFASGLEGVAEMWLEGTEPGDLARIPSLVPGNLRTLPFDRNCVKLFGRDSHHDAGNHPEQFGRLIPGWGGKDMWLVQVGAGVDAKGQPCTGGYASIEANAFDFRTLRPEPARSPERAPRQI